MATGTETPSIPVGTQLPHDDATADFANVLNDPRRWVVKKGIPLFKPHKRVDPNTGKLIDVDLPKLYRIAANMQRMERQGGVPVRMTLGHTEPGKPETEQPPIGGYYKNARVQPFGPKGELAVVGDEWLDPQYANIRKNYPYRSAEYYDDAEQITGVALLTRDPYLDLGVVAYTKSSSQPVHYDRAGVRPTMYQYVTGEQPMATPAVPTTPGVAPGAPPVPSAAPAAPPGSPTPGAPPTPYAGQYGARYKAWPGPAYRKANIGHRHPSGGAVYANYATEPPMAGPDMGMGGPPGGGGAGGDPIAQVYELLSAAVEVLGSALGGGGGPGGPGMGAGPAGPGAAAPQSPFPEEEEEKPAMNARYGRPRPGYAPQRPAAGARPRYYATPATPTPYSQPPAAPQAPAARTISGLPVGYQMKIDTLQYQLQQANEALKVLYYERDQADTEWCISEIRRLAAVGYPVGEFEVNELKARPRQERETYLNHIATKYGRVPTDAPPPLLGDPSPTHLPAEGPRPMTREEMDAALQATAGNHDLNTYRQAVQYMRGGHPQPQPQVQGYGEWNEGAAAPQPNPAAFPNPYEPSANGY